MGRIRNLRVTKMTTPYWKKRIEREHQEKLDAETADKASPEADNG